MDPPKNLMVKHQSKTFFKKLPLMPPKINHRLQCSSRKPLHLHLERPNGLLIFLKAQSQENPYAYIWN